MCAMADSFYVLQLSKATTMKMSRRDKCEYLKGFAKGYLVSMQVGPDNPLDPSETGPLAQGIRDGFDEHEMDLRDEKRIGIACLFREYQSNPLGCWVDLQYRFGQWAVIIGHKPARIGHVYKLRIGEVRRFLKFVHGESKDIMAVARKQGDWPLGIPVSVALQVAA